MATRKQIKEVLSQIAQLEQQIIFRQGAIQQYLGWLYVNCKHSFDKDGYCKHCRVYKDIKFGGTKE